MITRRLEYFCEVARLKSFTKAGEACFVSQTAISQQIAALEEYLGFKLLIRNKKTVSLTLAGMQFYHDALKIMEQANKSMEEARDTARNALGILRIGFFSLYDRVSIISLLRKFHEKFPRIKIDIAQYDYDSLNQNLRSKYIDIAFVFSENYSGISSISIRKIMRSPTRVCISKNHRLAQYDPVKIEHLRGENIISFNRHEFQHNFSHMRDIMIRKKLSPSNFLFVENVDAAVLMLEADMGVSFLPAIIRPYLGEGITMRTLSENIFSAFICDAIYLSDNKNPSLDLFLEIINSTVDDDKSKEPSRKADDP